jgi:predicted nucleic acid-binding protein
MYIINEYSNTSEIISQQNLQIIILKDFIYHSDIAKEEFSNNFTSIVRELKKLYWVNI